MKYVEEYRDAGLARALAAKRLLALDPGTRMTSP